MSFEKIRVNSRVKLIGKVKTGNLFVAFSVVFRVAVYMLAVMLLIHLNDYSKSISGRVFLLMCVAALILGVLLLWCARTVKDRWYAAISDGCNISVIDLVVRFTFGDILNSVGCGLVSSFLSLIRLAIFFGPPSALAVWLALLVRDGVSRYVFVVLVSGLAVITVCSLLFLAVSLGCVSLARSLCFCSAKKFVIILRTLEKSSFTIFRFSVFLSAFNRCLRRFSKIEFARMIALENYTFL